MQYELCKSQTAIPEDLVGIAGVQAAGPVLILEVFLFLLFLLLCSLLLPLLLFLLLRLLLVLSAFDTDSRRPLRLDLKSRACSTSSCESRVFRKRTSRVSQGWSSPAPCSFSRSAFPSSILTHTRQEDVEVSPTQSRVSPSIERMFAHSRGFLLLLFLILFWLLLLLFSTLDTRRPLRLHLKS